MPQHSIPCIFFPLGGGGVVTPFYSAFPRPLGLEATVIEERVSEATWMLSNAAKCRNWPQSKPLNERLFLDAFLSSLCAWRPKKDDGKLP